MSHLDPSSAARDAVPADPPPERPGAARALIERQVAALSELADIGMEIARAAGRSAVAALEGGEGAPVQIDPTLAYARAAKAVRMAFALQARLMKDLPAIERGEAHALAELRFTRRQRIVRLVEQVAQAQADDEDGLETACLVEEARERLRDTDEYSVLMTCPLHEAVARICEDLGLEPQTWIGEGSPFAPAAADTGAAASPPDPHRPPAGPTPRPEACSGGSSPGPSLHRSG